MTWREKQGTARFRTAEFHCPEGEHAGGRDLVSHQVPKSEKPPFHEDIGKKPETFSVEGYVLGDDYEAARDALIAALQEPGPGELSHPFYGIQRVVVDSWRRRESTSREGGICRFSITFKLAAVAPLAPLATVDAAGAVIAAAAKARTSVGARFMALYAATARYRTSVTSALNTATRAISDLTAIKELAVQDLANLQNQIATIEEAGAALVDSPADLLAAVVDLTSELAASLVRASEIPETVTLGFATAVGARAPFRALLALFDTDLGPRPGSGTATADAERDSFDAFAQLVQRAALITSCEAVITERFDSFDAALEARNQIAQRIDLHLEDIADDTFEDFVDLHAALVAALPGEESDLPRLVEVTPGATVASLVLAHRLYGSVTLENDIVRRNNIRDPALILGGRALQVLSDG